MVTPLEGSLKDLVDADNLFRAWYRQHAQRHAVEHGENSRIYADSQRNRQHGNGCEPGISPEHPQSVANLLP